MTRTAKFINFLSDKGAIPASYVSHIHEMLDAGITDLEQVFITLELDTIDNLRNHAKIYLTSEYKTLNTDQITEAVLPTGVNSDQLSANGIEIIGETSKQLLIHLDDPLQMELIDFLEFITKKEICVIDAKIAPELNSLLSAELQFDLLDERISDNMRTVLERSNDSETVKYQQRIFAEAIKKGASDVHIEAEASGYNIRFRVHGELFSISEMKHQDLLPLVSRIKLLAGMNIAEQRQPQDGKFFQLVRDKQYDFRVSCIPTQFGENLVVRILAREEHEKTWAQLGFNKTAERKIAKLLAKKNGLILVTGPTGSGKSTTLYKMLRELEKKNLKICTIEDPIEYSVEGISQTQVHPEIGFDFSAAIRSFLRQDPDVLMIGEIRDKETAEMACRAALVGRLVLSTLHTGSVEETINRMLDLGVEKYIVDATVVGIISQRLERKRCGKCNGKGCKYCNGIGFIPRQLLYDLVEL